MNAIEIMQEAQIVNPRTVESRNGKCAQCGTYMPDAEVFTIMHDGACVHTDCAETYNDN